MSPKVYSFGDIIRLVKNNRLWYIEIYTTNSLYYNDLVDRRCIIGSTLYIALFYNKEHITRYI